MDPLEPEWARCMNHALKLVDAVFKLCNKVLDADDQRTQEREEEELREAAQQRRMRDRRDEDRWEHRRDRRGY